MEVKERTAKKERPPRTETRPSVSFVTLHRHGDAGAGCGEDGAAFLGCNSYETIDNGPIELRAARFLEPANRLFERKALPIRAVRRHRVECVNDADDPRADRNFGAG